MNNGGILPLVQAEAFERVTSFRGLTQNEKEFVFCVLLRLHTRSMEAIRRMIKLLGFIPVTDAEVEAAAAIMRAVDGPIKPIKEEILVGLSDQPRPRLILEVLQAISTLSFSPRVIGYMLEIFS